jgi:hypothetical protein
MRFGLWDVRSLYRTGSIMTVSKELSRYKLDLVRVQEVSGTEPAGEYTFFFTERGMGIMNVHAPTDDKTDDVKDCFYDK